MKPNKDRNPIMFLIFYMVIGCFAIICIIPFWLVLAASFTENTTFMMDGYRLIPEKLTLNAYEFVFSDKNLWNSFSVSLFVTVVGTVLSMIISSSAAFALSQKKLKYKNGISFFVYFTMLFNGGLVPFYIMVTQYLRLKNSIWSLILPALVNPFYLFLIRNFFKTLPDSLMESANIDGANDILILFKIVLPISLPGIATVSLFYALDYWNEWFKALLFIDDSKLYPLQYIIMRILSNASFVSEMFAKTGITKTLPTYTVRMATVIVTIGPIIFLYPYLQKYFVKGITLGSVKG